MHPLTKQAFHVRQHSILLRKPQISFVLYRSMSSHSYSTYINTRWTHLNGLRHLADALPHPSPEVLDLVLDRSPDRVLYLVHALLHLLPGLHRSPLSISRTHQQVKARLEMVKTKKETRTRFVKSSTMSNNSSVTGGSGSILE